ncbi:DNA-directed DNA/RNA polymerase mu [Centroberyx affinis]|uniref:DNA-directed DNA/RNA polymerase mu n=1 Tax=Centroberyx affinis TaxID=166261 RepID=UPI003A5C4369
MVPLKRRRVVSSSAGATGTDSNAKPGGDKVTEFPLVVLFLLERKMGASRRAFLSQLGRRKGFQVEELFSRSVTHVVSENNSGDEVRTWLDSQDGGRGQRGAHCRPPVHLLDISWYTESMREGRPVEILDRHRLQEQKKNQAEGAAFSVPSYACQRRTALQGHNTLLTDALSVLADNAELTEDEGRGVAFRRAAAVLKSLPGPVTGMEQLRGLPCLGEHSQRVIKDILENGASSEAESIKQSERYKALKVLTGIFGVGAKTADRWFREGIHSLSQLQGSGHTLNHSQQAGLKHYDDINRPVTKAEADAIGAIVEEAVSAVLPGAEVTLTGGFRRGKLTGHDVDFLITHPEEGKEEGLMPKLVSWLESQGFLLYQKTTRNSYLESKEGPGRPASNMDRFERCLSIFKLATDRRAGQRRGAKLSEVHAENGLQTNTHENFNTTRETHSRKVCSLEAPTQSKGEALTDSYQQIDPNPNPLSLIHPSDIAPHMRGQEEHSEADQTQTSGPRPWRAVRVDLVVSPVSQFAFALLGWTGSKLFERELRRWAGHEKAMSLSSHALYDNKQSLYLRASSEEDIFAHLGLEYIPPSERNA